MLADYLPILIAILVMAGFAGITILLSSLLGPKRKTHTKLSPYECGLDPVGSARSRYSIKFYVIAMIFIIFDIEALFLYPWAVIYRKLGLFGLVEMGIFVLILLLGFIYLWKKGALEWE